MPRTLQMIFFFLIFTLILGSLHYYAWARLVRDPHLPSWLRISATLAIFILGVSLIINMVLMRVLPRSYGSPLAWLAYTWMGVLIFLFLVLIGTEIFRLGVFKFSNPTDEARRTFFQRVFALASLGTGLFVSGFAFLQANYRLQVRNLSIPLKRLPKSLSGFRIAQLTDVHIGPTLGKEWLSEVVETTNQLKPDLIAITGDLVDGSVAQLSEHVAPLRNLKARYGVFFVTGNHEYYSGADEWVEELLRLGIRVLRNERVLIQAENGDSLELLGIDDFHSGGFPGHGPNLPKAMEGHQPDNTKILLAHQPAAVEEASKLGIDLQLSGHTHGGQFWPWNYVVRLQQPYVAGLHRHKSTETQIYVSPGTGYWGPPMRLGTSSEITNILLLAENEM